MCVAALRQEVQGLLGPTQALAEWGSRVPRELWRVRAERLSRLQCVQSHEASPVGEVAFAAQAEAFDEAGFIYSTGNPR